MSWGAADQVLVAICTVVLTGVAVLSWRVTRSMEKLTARQNWLTGALESHSTLQQIMSAHDRGIPVMWWDPTLEKWDPSILGLDRGHRKIAKLPLIVMSLPEAERVNKSKGDAIEGRPLTETEMRELEEERRRLARKSRKK